MAPAPADRGPMARDGDTVTTSRPAPRRVKPDGRPSEQRCGGVDAGPYGLSRRRRWWLADDIGGGGDDGVEVPFFDNDTRPRSVVVPWRPGRPVLFGVRDAGCHRALFDHCARTAGAQSELHVRALREWMNGTVLPLLKVDTGPWYPALWGARLAVRQLDKTAAATAAATTDNDDHYRDYYFDGIADAELVVPNGNFYATVVLTSATICWTAALCAVRVDLCLGWLIDYTIFGN